MYSWFLLIVALATVFVAVWSVVAVLKAQHRVLAAEASLQEKEAVVGELADELVMASKYLYEAMDKCLADIEQFQDNLAELPESAPSPEESPVAAEPAEPAELVGADLLPDALAEPVVKGLSGALKSIDPTGSVPTPDDTPAEVEDIITQVPEETDDSYDSHFEALTLAAEGIDPVDIARRTGIGVEELRLLMRFQEELNV